MTATEAIRTLFPTARRRSPVGIVHNGGRRRVVECILCGARESCCNEYPETQRVRLFRAHHDSECGAQLVAKAQSR